MCMTTKEMGVKNTANADTIINSADSTTSSTGSSDDEVEPLTTKAQRCGFYYLTPQAARNIPLYKYRGEDRSFLYKYVLSPLAQYLVDNWTPRTVAPNVITFFGLSLMMAAYCAIWYYAPNLKLEKVVVDDDNHGHKETGSLLEENEEVFDVPRWIFLFNCIAMLAYQTLDNMDGKQARRTGSSSPLGLLFDHGCDAINSIFGSANWIVAMGLDPFSTQDSLLCWTIVLGPYLMFYIATWEEYYTGELILPIFNGPNEGLVGGAMLSLTTYFCGPEFWHQFSWFDQALQPLFSSLLPSSNLEMLPRMRNADIVVLAACFGIFQEILLKMAFVIGNYGRQALLDVLPALIVSIATFVIGYCDPSIWLDIPRTSLHLVAALMVEMVTELMRMHISEEKFQPFSRWLIAPLLVLTVLVVTMTCFGAETPSWVGDYLTAYSTAACTYVLMKVCIVVDEICRVLNVWCFDIVTPRKQQYYAHETPHNYLTSTGGSGQAKSE